MADHLSDVELVERLKLREQHGAAEAAKQLGIKPSALRASLGRSGPCSRPDHQIQDHG